MSASDFAKLAGVSPLTIYNWEHGKARPRREQFAALVALRGVGKREAQAKLAILSTASKSSAISRIGRTSPTRAVEQRVRTLMNVSSSYDSRITNWLTDRQESDTIYLR